VSATTPSTAMQKQILAAIQALSDRMDRQGMSSALGIDTRFDAQDKLYSLEANGRIAPIVARLDSIDRNIAGIREQFVVLNGTVRAHDSDIKVLKVFCDEQVKPALVKVVDLRIEVAKYLAAGGGFGVVMTVLIGAGKALGWW